jgi:thioredoxin reductase (NADPH)
VALLGSGNSAGQAALLLLRYVERLTIITVEESLDSTMSKYLVDRITSLPNVKVESGATVVEVQGEEKIEAVTIERSGGEREEVEVSALFIWIGAETNTDWLPEAVTRDDDGFVLSGRHLTHRHLDGWSLDRYPFYLETGMAGVFVAGDVRHASVKRAGSAVGEGAMAVQFVHQYLKGR